MSRSKKSELEVEDIEPEPAEPNASGIGGLVEAWKSPRDPFDDYVRRVSDAYFSSHLRLEPAARWCETSAAEIAAILHLATLEDKELGLLAKQVPPKTTWFLFASAETDAIRAGLEALEDMPEGGSPHVTVARAIRKLKGPDAVERVGRLPGEVIGYMAKKAKQYDLLRPKDRSVLVDFAKQKRYGKPLSPKQAVYLHGMLTQLVEGGAVKEDSPDGDQDKCDPVLRALGVIS